MPEEPQRLEPLTYRGGAAGALAPFALFLGGVAALGLSGAPSERGFWPIQIAALALAMLLARDRSRWADAVIDGMSQRLVMVMVLAWMLAGVLGTLINASGFVEALVWVARGAGLTGGAYVVGAFLVCCVVSTSVGTSLGTVILCAPLLYPAGGALGADPVVLIGAILGGATFGDNISPVSDTTIASSVTQRADMGGVVRSRLRYALPAAAIALSVYSLAGAAAADAPAATAGLPGASPAGLPMVLAPALVLGLLLARRHLLEGLLAGIVGAAALGLGLGRLTPSQIFFVDPERYTAGGLVVDGIERAVGVSVFTLLLMGLVAGIEATGLVARVVAAAEKRAATARAAEWRIFGTVSAVCLLTTHSTVALITVGDFTRTLGERFAIGPYRRANILDVGVCSWPMIFPWFIPAIITASTTASGEAYGMPRIGPMASGLANVHSWALLAVLLFALATGWGRRDATDRGA
ncbi:MAG: Na+/H+ antiporter NhaC family protein [Thermoanaerobaculia bacterium]|nr:Na+/H+ antiporter NhaC family protein [Thermoanaerobaculia bacterium]